MCTLAILLRQHLSLNDQFGGDPTDDTSALGTRKPPAAAERPTLRHTLDLKLLHAKNNRVSRPFGVRAASKVRSPDSSGGSVLTLENGSLFPLGPRFG